MLKLTEDGYIFISKNGIAYNILEGITIGTEPRKTSDMIFIMLRDIDWNVENHIVGWLFGAWLLVENPKSYEVSIGKMVEEYEKENGME